MTGNVLAPVKPPLYGMIQSSSTYTARALYPGGDIILMNRWRGKSIREIRIVTDYLISL
jgi:hypothetical protein